MPDAEPAAMRQRALWRQFLPLSLSDVAMALVDPLVITTLAHLPNARTNIAALGVAKAIAVFFESPIIMVLHASNTLAASPASRRAMARFTAVALCLLSALLAALTVPAVFAAIGAYVFGASDAIASSARSTLVLLVLWPATIGWRRFFQGLLIHEGHASVIARASLGRLLAVAVALAVGFAARLPGWALAGTALMAGLLTEAVWVTLAAWRTGALIAASLRPTPDLPVDIKGVWRFYWPLANSMLVVWGGRALLLGVIARAEDGAIAIAAWLAAWGFVLVIANATRMVQQVTIRNRAVDERVLFRFALMVGLAASLIVVLVATTPPGMHALASYVGQDAALLDGIRPVILLASVIPVLVALQNALQGFLIRAGDTRRVNAATWLGSAVLLSSAVLAIAIGLPGAMAAGAATVLALLVEAAALAGANAKRSSRARQGGS